MPGDCLLTPSTAGPNLKLLIDAFDATKDINNVGKRKRENPLMLWQNERYVIQAWLNFA
jgi:hypothetical protein